MVSIIVPVYKAAEYIARTIACVREQTYTDWELILVDDASSDGTADVIRSIIGDTGDERIRLIECESNRGAAHARNTGLDSAHGRYIAFLDADDIWLPGRLQTGMEYMHEHPEAGFVFTAYEFGDEDAQGTGRVVHVPAVLDYDHALSRTVIFTTTTLFDTELIPLRLIHMPYVESEDTATWWQILKEGHKAYGIDEVTAIYRRPAQSLSSNKFAAIRRIWNLYRNVEHLSCIRSAVCFTGWAFRATLRRL